MVQLKLKSLFLLACKDYLFLIAVLFYLWIMCFTSTILKEISTFRPFLINGSIKLVDDNIFVTLTHSLNRVSLSKKNNIVYFKLKVYSNETLSQIALQRDLRLETLLSVNNWKKLRRFKDGESIIIPDRDGILHIAKAGDLISKIAKIYNINEGILEDVNGIKSRKLYEGQYIFIPNAKFKDKKIENYKDGYLLFPVVGIVKNYFGTITNKTTGLTHTNDGIDILSPTDSPIYASADGVVAGGGLHPSYGYYLILSHKNNLQTFYGYLDSINYKKGATIKQGTKIAKVGQSGVSGGGVLHFSVFKLNKAINPMDYLR